MDHRLVGVDLHLDGEFEALGQDALQRIGLARIDQLGLGQAPDVVDHAALGIVEPAANELLDGGSPVFGAEFLQPPLGDARAAKTCKVVAIPLVRNPDAGPAHPHDVLDVLEVALDAHTGKHQGALMIDIARQDEIGGRDRVADIRHVALGDAGEQMLALPEHRHHVGVVGGMGVAAIGVIVEIGIAAADVAFMVTAHVGGLDMAAEDVDRKSLSRCEQLVVAGDETAGEIARRRNDRRPRCAQQRVGHLADDTIEAVGHHRHQDGIEAGVWIAVSHAQALSRNSGCSFRPPTVLPTGRDRRRWSSLVPL